MRVPCVMLHACMVACLAHARPGHIFGKHHDHTSGAILARVFAPKLACGPMKVGFVILNQVGVNMDLRQGL